MLDLQEVLVLDPDLSKDYLDRIQNRTKERRYTFDYAFGPSSTNLVCIYYLVEFIFLFLLSFVSVLRYSFSSLNCARESERTIATTIQIKFE